MRARLAICCFGLLFLAAPLGGAKAPEWIEARSAHFQVISNAKARQVIGITEDLEEFRHLLGMMFPGMRLDPPTPATVVLLKDTKTFQLYAPRTLAGKPLERIGGFMQPAHEGMFLVVDLSHPGATETAFHEYIHLVLRLNFEQAPVWLNEGLAEFYERTEIGGANFTLGDYQPAWLYALDRDFLPLDLLLAVDHQSEHYNVEEKRRVFYGESWLLVHYLMLAEEGRFRPQLVRFVQLLRQGAPQDDAFRQAIGGDLEKLQKQLREYTRRRRMPVFAGRMPTPAAVGRPEAAPLDAAVAEARLTDLWLARGNLEAAERALAQLAAAGRAGAEVRYRLGKIALIRNQPREAEDYFRAALAARPDDAALRYYAARAISDGRLKSAAREEDREAAADEVVELLAPVVAAGSDFPDALDLFLQARVARDDPPGELIPQVERAAGLHPQRLHFQLLLAHLYDREQRFDDAEKTLESVARAAPNSPHGRQAQEWLESLRARRAEQGEPGGEIRLHSVLPPARRATPAEPPPVPPPAPPEVRYVRGTLADVACTGDSAVLTLLLERPKNEPPRALHLAVRSLEKLIVLDPARSGRRVSCGAARDAVGINYRVEPSGAAAGAVISLEFDPPRR